MQTLYLLCGMPFSGKSTLGKAVAQYLNSPYISLDEINEARNLFGGEGIPIEEWEKTHSLARDELQILMQSRQDIVVDDTSCFRWLRDRFRNFAAQYSYHTKIIFLDVPFAEIERRIKDNQKTKARHQVKSDIVREMSETFEFPEEDEDVMTYNADRSVNEWIDRNLKQIAN